MTKIRDLHAGWMKDAVYQKEFEALESEFSIAGELVRARANAGLTQEQLADRMGTKQEVVARWEGGKVLPSTRTLTRVAEATGTKLKISFAPAHAVVKWAEAAENDSRPPIPGAEAKHSG